MEKIQINEIRKIQLDILEHLGNFCNSNGIQYFLSNGSMLGAVKYNGYIPWDDDIDICMLREDYERLIMLYTENNTNPRYKLFSIETNNDYLFPFAKLSDSSTILKENNINNGVELGVNIDIFPIDGYGNSQKEATLLYKRIEKLRNKLNWAKIEKYYGDNVIKRFVKMIISKYYKRMGARKIVEDIHKIASQQPCSDLYIGNVVWGFYKDGEAHSKEVFVKSIKVEFEGKEYPIPIGFDSYLKKLYGNYKLDPPLDKQVTHHNYVAYKKEVL